MSQNLHARDFGGGIGGFKGSQAKTSSRFNRAKCH